MSTGGDPALLAEPVRRVLHESAGKLKAGEIRPLRQILASKLGQEKMMALLSGAFGLLAPMLAAVGLYGVIAYGVERRRQEIGIRLALGAARWQVTKVLLRDTLAVLSAGLVLGFAGSFAMGRSLRGLLFGLTPHDPAMLAAAGALLGAVGLIAGYLPARRAARTNPTDALRQE